MKIIIFSYACVLIHYESERKEKTRKREKIAMWEKFLAKREEISCKQEERKLLTALFIPNLLSINLSINVINVIQLMLINVIYYYFTLFYIYIYILLMLLYIFPSFYVLFHIIMFTFIFIINLFLYYLYSICLHIYNIYKYIILINVIVILIDCRLARIDRSLLFAIDQDWRNIDQQFGQQ